MTAKPTTQDTTGGAASHSADREALLIERDELLKSIEDLKREFDAGDIDDLDYQTLLDSYTARTAEVLRALTDEPRVGGRSGRSNPAQAASVGSVPPPKKSPWKKIAAIGGISAFAVVAGIVVARSAGERVGSTGLTGSVRSAANERQDQIDSLMTTARDNLANDPITALKAFDQVRDLDPENVEAITYGGWLVRNVSRSAGDEAQSQELLNAAIKRLDEAIKVDPNYPDALAFRAIIFLRDQNDPASAVVLFDRLDTLNPPQQITMLTSAAATEAREALKNPATASTAAETSAAPADVATTTSAP